MEITKDQINRLFRMSRSISKAVPWLSATWFSATRFCALALCVQLCMATAAHADSLKKLVFRDCTEAQKKVIELQGTERREFVEYLDRVLLLESQGIDDMIGEPAVQPTAPPKPGDSPMTGTGSDMLRTLQPRRETNAKLCAVQLLQILSPEAFDAVPEMVRLAQQVTTPADLQAALDKVIWPTTVQAAAHPTYVPSMETFERLIKLMGGEQSYYAENILVEFHRHSVPWLLTSLRQPNSTENDRAASVLLRIDPQGEQLGPIVVQILQSSDATARLRAISLMRKLKNLPPDALALLVARLRDADDLVHKKALVALHDLDESKSPPQGMNFSDAAITAIFAASGQLSDEAWTTVANILVKTSANQRILIEQVKRLYESGDPGLRSRAISLAGKLHQQFALALEILTSSLYSDSPSLQIESIKALGNLAKESIAPNEKQEKLSDQIVSTILKFLKSPLFPKAAGSKREILNNLAEISLHLNTADNRMALTPYLIDVLNADDITFSATVMQPALAHEKEYQPEVRSLIAFGKDVITPTTKLLKNANPQTRQHAIEVLSAYFSEPKVLKDVLQLWGDRDASVRLTLADELKRHTQVKPEELLKLFRTSKGEARYVASEVLLARGLFDQDAVTVFREGFGQQTCLRKAQIASETQASDPALRLLFSTELVNCLKDPGAGRTIVLEKLSLLAPIPVEAAKLAITVLQDPQFDDAFRARALNALQLTTHHLAELNPFIESLLRSSDNSIREQVLSALDEFTSPSEGIQNTLKKIVDDDDTEPAIRARSASVLFQLSPNALNFQDFFFGELKSDRAQWAINALTQIPENQSVPLLLNVHKQLPDLRKYTALQALASLPLAEKFLIPEASAEARSAINDIRSIAEEAIASTDARRRYYGFRLLVDLGPDSPNLENALRAQLVGPFAHELLTLKLYSKISSIVEKVITAPQSFVEQQNAQAVKVAG